MNRNILNVKLSYSLKYLFRSRYDRPEREERMVSPHTWFFCHLGPLLARSARLQQPPSFEAVAEDPTGLPTYEEAIKLGGGPEEVDGPATEDESDDDVERGSESPHCYLQKWIK